MRSHWRRKRSGSFSGASPGSTTRQPLIARGCARSAPTLPATMTIWRGCANGRLPAGRRKHDARPVHAAPPIRKSPPGSRPMPAPARPIPWPIAWRGCCWPMPSRRRSCASPSPRRRRRRCRRGCSRSWANGPCWPTTNCARRSSRSAATRIPNCAKARRLFAAALETPGGLKVLTLHAFCQIVLSRFPLEAGIAPGFRGAGRPDRRAN